MSILLGSPAAPGTGSPAGQPAPLPAANDPGPGAHYRCRMPSCGHSAPVWPACAPAARNASGRWHNPPEPPCAAAPAWPVPGPARGPANSPAPVRAPVHRRPASFSRPVLARGRHPSQAWTHGNPTYGRVRRGSRDIPETRPGHDVAPGRWLPTRCVAATRNSRGGAGLTDAAPGSARTTYLAVTDIEAAHRELTGRGVKVSDIRHKWPIDGWAGGWQPGPNPGR